MDGPRFECHICGVAYIGKEFEVYNKDFCSMDCLKAYKFSLSEPEKQKGPHHFTRCDAGGPACC